MPLDFSGQSLVGRSFKGENLSGANFSYADIRSVSFSDADLTGAIFYKSRSGLSALRQALQVILLLVGSAMVGVTATVAGAFSATLLIRENIQAITAFPGMLCIASLTSISLALIIKGYTPRGFQFIWASCALSVAGITIGVLTSLTSSASDAAGGATGAMILIVVNSVILTIAGFIGRRRLIGLCLFCASAIAALTFPIIYPEILNNIASASSPSITAEPFNVLGMVIVFAEVLLTGAYVAIGILNKAGRADAEKFDLIQKVATPFTAIGGTSFRRSVLTDADFSYANLHCTDFTNAHLIGTSFYQSKAFNTAKFNSTIYTNTPARLLALTRNGHGKSYCNLNLQGINLIHADLSEANFTGCNLNDAILQQANLVNATLNNAQAIGTNFQGAQLTGCCLEAWNIDSTTQINDVECQFVYLRTQRRERRPSSGTFNPGEFSKLFQEVIDTVDLIFQGGLDWQALQTMMAEANAQQAAEAPPLNIRSIENKDDGVVVVRVDAPPEADKSMLHADLTEHYSTALAALEAKYQYQLQAKDEQIAIYQEQQESWRNLAQSLAGINQPRSASKIPSKLVSLKLTTNQNNIQASLQIGSEGRLPFLDYTAALPLAADLLSQYGQWQASYRQYLSIFSSSNLLGGDAYLSRLSAPADQLTNVSIEQTQQQLQQQTHQVHHRFNQWLSADSFRLLREKLLETLSAEETIRIVLQADDSQLWRLPWHSWELLSRYPQAEITLSTHHYQRTHHDPQQANGPLRGSEQKRGDVRILVVLGEGISESAPAKTRLDLQADYQLISNLPNTQITTLVEPTRQAFNDYLWENAYDILFFAGHSTSDDKNGYLRLSADVTLTLDDLDYALKRACKQGLQLAIFNSCDGLGLVHSLSELPLDHMIVMREAVPDKVAQVFLKNLLDGFSEKRLLPQVVREAREKLQGLENHFPCASWLPVLCQTAAAEPLTWQKLRGYL